MKKWETVGEAMQLSWVMLFSLLIPLLGGIWLDKKLGTTPLFILIGMFLGIGAATIGVARMVTRMYRQSRDTDSDRSPEANSEEERD
jgi:F0F1-type ATP synthase assembly protein I